MPCHAALPELQRCQSKRYPKLPVTDVGGELQLLHGILLAACTRSFHIPGVAAWLTAASILSDLLAYCRSQLDSTLRERPY